MPDSPRRAMLVALLAFVLGVLAAVAATATGGAVMAPWWMLVAAVCLALPFGSWSARSARSRVVAIAGVLTSSVLLLGVVGTTASVPMVAVVVTPLGLALAMMLTPYLRGHRIVGAALFGLPVLLVGATVPVTLGSTEIDDIGGFDVATAVTAILPAIPAMLLLGGAAMLVGSVLDLASRLRTAVSAETVRGIAYAVGGLTLVLVAAAGVVAAGTLSGTASRIGASAAVLAVAAAGALWHGLRTLARSREVSRVGGGMAVFSVASVLAGTLLAPADALATAFALVALLMLSTVLGAVAGLCGAAALVRTPRRDRRALHVVLRSLRARIAHS